MTLLYASHYSFRFISLSGPTHVIPHSGHRSSHSMVTAPQMWRMKTVAVQCHLRARLEGRCGGALPTPSIMQAAPAL